MKAIVGLITVTMLAAMLFSYYPVIRDSVVGGYLNDEVKDFYLRERMR